MANCVPGPLRTRNTSWMVPSGEPGGVALGIVFAVSVTANVAVGGGGSVEFVGVAVGALVAVGGNVVVRVGLDVSAGGAVMGMFVEAAGVLVAA